MSRSPQEPPPPHQLLSLREPSAQFLLVLQSIAQSLAYSRLGSGKNRIKIVEQSRPGEDPLLVYGTMNVLHEMDLRHPAALFLIEIIESHHKEFGMGCTTLLAWIGLFAGMISRLKHSYTISPSFLSSTLSEIAKICTEETERPQSGCKISLRFVATSRPNAAASTSLHTFLVDLGAKLSHGQDEPMSAAVCVVEALLRAQGITSERELLDAVAMQEDLTQEWDLSSLLTLQPSMGASVRGLSSSSVSNNRFSSQWELMEGLPLDLMANELPPIRRILKHIDSPSTQERVAGMVLVLGDIALPETVQTISVASGPSNIAAMEERLRGAEIKRDSFLRDLASRLTSLDVHIVLAKGSFNKDIQAHLLARNIICLETVNFPKLDSISRMASIPMICELSQVARAHVGRVNLTLKSIGWNPERTHQHVVRDMVNHHGAFHESDMKLFVQSIASSFSLLSLTLFSSHATQIHSRIFSTSVWNCLNRLQHALRDGYVCAGNGFVEGRWIERLEEQAEKLESGTDGREIFLGVATAFRQYLHHLHANDGMLDETQLWVRVHGTLSRDRSDHYYDNFQSKLSALSRAIYLIQTFAHLDSTLLCANGRTIYQLLDGRADATGHSVRVL